MTEATNLGGTGNGILPKIDAAQVTDDLIKFIRQTYASTKFSQAVIGVSGGIDSAVSTTLLARALGPENVFTLLLPFGNQSMTDAQALINQLGIPVANQKTINIQSAVESLMASSNLIVQSGTQLGDLSLTQIRQANLMVRVRMIFLFDWAKALPGLVCGTENKSEHYLGYFTRFGDEASDLEPLRFLYKTQLRDLARYLGLPQIFLDKPPSAGLWTGQTDESELGFGYELADQVLYKLIDLKQSATTILADYQAKYPELVNQVKAVINRHQSQKFKLLVPYLPI